MSPGPAIPGPLEQHLAPPPVIGFLGSASPLATQFSVSCGTAFGAGCFFSFFKKKRGLMWGRGHNCGPRVSFPRRSLRQTGPPHDERQATPKLSTPFLCSPPFPGVRGATDRKALDEVGPPPVDGCSSPQHSTSSDVPAAARGSITVFGPYLPCPAR